MTLTFTPFGVASEYSCSGWRPTGSSFSCVGPAIGRLILANWPPLGLFHVQTLGGTYSDSLVIGRLRRLGGTLIVPPARGCATLQRELTDDWSGRGGLKRADDVHEDAVTLEAQVRQVFREVREVVAQAGLHVLTEMPIEADQSAGTGLVEIGHLQHAALD